MGFPRLCFTLIAASTFGVLTLACGDDGPVRTASDDERGSIGPAAPTYAYCTNLGYEANEGRCSFPDGTSCELWAFYRAECGAPMSYCARHGGRVSTKVDETADQTSKYAVCAVDGVECLEADFVRTGTCE